VKPFIEQNSSSINENNSRKKFNKFVLFLGLVSISSIIVAGTVSSATFPRWNVDGFKVFKWGVIF
jgi:hypothetical protein